MAKKVTKQVTKPTAKSAKKPTAKKTTTKQGQGKEQGGLEEALTRSEQFFENYKKTIYTIVALIIVIIAGGMIYTYKIVQPREVRASEAIFPGETYFMNGDFRTALEGNAYGTEHDSSTLSLIKTIKKLRK